MISETDQHFLDELFYCLKQTDIVKTKALCSFFPTISPAVQLRVLNELNKAPFYFSLPILLYIASLDVHGHQFEENLCRILIKKIKHNPLAMLAYMDKQDHPRRHIFIKIAGQLKIPQFKSILERLLHEEENPNLLREIIKAIAAFEHIDCIPRLAQLIQHHSHDISYEAIYALRRFNSPAAVDYLANSLTGIYGIDQVIVESLADIQSDEAIEKLVYMIGSSDTDVRNWAMDYLIEIGNKSIPFLINQLESASDDVVIHTINILGNIGDSSALSVFENLMQTHKENSNIRFALFEAIGRIKTSALNLNLFKGLEDEEEQVRLAAANAINRHFGIIPLDDLKTLLQRRNQQQIVESLIDAQADTVIAHLISHDDFAAIAKEYISTKASPEIRSYMTQRYGAFSETQQVDEAHGVKPKLTICVVDDSKMILKLYEKQLTALGYHPVPFNMPEQAISHVLTSKPDILITDLNMPKINGLQLAKTIRKRFSKDDLPIILITTQNDFLEKQLIENRLSIENKDKESSDIDTILYKPFRDEDLVQTIDMLLKKQTSGL
ncbi:MAG: response regulator [Desulfobacterales bacterium]|nr:response regulator [Desulfobacterales bacterium]